MKFDPQLLVKSLSPKIVAKAVQTFDRATTIVIGVTWAAAILMMVFAIYVMSLSASARQSAQDALTAEPSLPKIVHRGMDLRQIQLLTERMQHSYPDLKFNLQTNNQSLSVVAVDGSKFRQWLTALSYIDTISPQYHWSMDYFCVGKCPSSELMHATLVGDSIGFEMPQP